MSDLLYTCVSSYNDLIQIEHPLATGFSLLDGFVTVQCPDVVAGNDYAIVCECSLRVYTAERRSDVSHTVFGDSGNIGEDFTIVEA